MMILLEFLVELICPFLRSLIRLQSWLVYEEVKQALFDMGPWKALGLDGYPTGFYQDA